MSLHDIDKHSEDRGAPKPNTGDSTLQRPALRTVAGGTSGNIGLGTVVDKNLAANTITQGSIVPATLGGPHAFVSGDDSSGDYTDLQSAIDDTVGVGGGIVFIRNGTYLLDNDISLYSNITLQGETAGGVVFDFQNQAYQFKAVGSSPYNTGTISVNNFSTTVTGSGTSWDTGMIGLSIFISGLAYAITNVSSATSLTIELPFEITSVSGASYVIAAPVDQTVLQNLSVQNSTHASGALYFLYCTTPTVDTVNIFDSTIGSYFEWCMAIEYKGGYTSRCGTGLQVVDSATATLYDFEVYGSTGDNVILTRFINVSFSNFTNSTAGVNAITTTSCKNMSIYDFAIQSAGAKGLELISCSDIEISNANVIEAVSDGIKLTSNNTDISIDNVSLLTNGGYGINIAASSNNQSTITSSFFANNVLGTISDSGTATFRAHNQPDSTTANNTILDTDGTFAANSDLRLATQKATKSYVDAVAAGLTPKPSVRLATAAALAANTYANGASGVGATLTGSSTGVLTVDGSTVALNDRILVKDEGTGANNGIYKCTTAGAVGVAYVLTRAVDCDQAADIPGAYTFTEDGTANTGAGFVVASSGPFTMGSTTITWTQFSGAGEITAGTGLSKSANTLSINTAVTVDKTTAQALSNKDMSSGTNSWPTFNQNTTGSAAKWTTARNLAGNSVDGSANVAFSNSFIAKGTSDSGLSGAQFLGALATGIIKNTTTTGVLSIAVNSDLPSMSATVGGAVPTPPNNTTTFLRGDGTWGTPSGAGNVSGPGSSTDTDIATFSGTSGTVIQDSGKTLPSGTVVGTTDAQTLTNKILTSPTLTGMSSWGGVSENTTFLDQSGTNKTWALSNSRDFAAVDTLEVDAAYSLEIPASSSLEIIAYMPARPATVASPNGSHLVLSAAPNKLVKSTVLRSDNQTNTYQVGNSVILTGWVVFPAGAAANKSATISFGVTFLQAPIVTATYGGDNISGTTTYGAGAVQNAGDVVVWAHTITTTNFIGRLQRASAWGAGDTTFLQWMAIGEI